MEMKKRLFLSAEKKIVLREKIEKFSKMHGVRDYMAELFIDEVRMSDDEANEELRKKAKLMGLMEWN